MRVTVGTDRYRDGTVDLRGVVGGGTAARAVRSGTAITEAGTVVSVACLQPGPVHERAGFVREGMGLRLRTALAAAARSRGLTAPQDRQVRRLDERLREIGPTESTSTASARRRVAGVEADVERLRERVATLRGRLDAARDGNGNEDTGAVRSDLREATRALSEAETEQVAARQALDRARQRAREARDRREQRRRLEDERANVARDARRHLVEELHAEFAAAVAAVPGSSPPADPFDADGVSAALAVCRVARLHAPVVLDCDRFPDAKRAAAWLDAPVIRT